MENLPMSEKCFQKALCAGKEWIAVVQYHFGAGEQRSERDVPESPSDLVIEIVRIGSQCGSGCRLTPL